MIRDRESRLISGCASWDEFFAAVGALPTTAQQGTAFERLTQFYLQTQPEYQSGLDAVWTLAEVPADVRKQLRLTHVDEGIDLIARTREGDFWAIQCKFRADKAHRLTRRELATFTSLAFHTCQGFSLAIVAHTCAKPVKKHDLLPKTVEIGLERWLTLTGDDWKCIKRLTLGKSVLPTPRKPRPHQQRAVEEARQHFVVRGASRGRMIMPCGTGKSLTAFWIARALGAGTILVAVPSLALIRQSLTDWTREYLAAGVVPEWLVVCGDESTGNLERDEFVGATYDLGIPTTTDATEIADFLGRAIDKPKIVFATYQSGSRLAQGAKRANLAFDLGIFDEAHKTVGAKSKAFAALLFDANVQVRRRLFMTATERVLSGRNDDVLSMDDPDTYGDRFFLLSFKQAIGDRLISDYRIVTITVSDERIQRLIEDRCLLNVGKPGLDEADAQSLAAGIALKRAYEKYGVRHAISFHRSIRSADQFAEQQATLNEMDALGPRVTSLHISSKKSAGERADLMRSFAGTERALLTNARCLTEGVDIPAIDCVLFADPKQSTIDIVQAAGRALRRFEGKEFGYILLPLVVPLGMTFDEFADTTEFRQVAKTITALSMQDERIAEEFRAIGRTRKSTGRLVEIDGDVTVGMSMDAASFASAISTSIWERVGRANWRIFADARDYARSLNLRVKEDWDRLCRERVLPADIPASPRNAYLTEWRGWGDWLGTGSVANFNREYRPFEAAREFARSLGIESVAEWRRRAKAGALPSDIPRDPADSFREKGWISWGDWLGTGAISSRKHLWRPFDDARAFARSLGLVSFQDWREYVGSGRLPRDVPASPEAVYRNRGWISFRDWLGSDGRKRVNTRFQTFFEAREFVRSLELQNVSAWRHYVRSGRKPEDIPAAPDRAYADVGWAGFPDWLGTKPRKAPQQRIKLARFRSFEDARLFARSLGLESVKQWNSFCASGRLPTDIPIAPWTSYAKKGWAGSGDWLGTGYIATFKRRFRPFHDARRFVRGLGIKDQKAWVAFCKSGARPADIPSNPQQVYKESGWANYGDWLGTGSVATFNKHYHRFKEAREVARGLGIRSAAEWKRKWRQGELPEGLPATPDCSYAKRGWTGWADWLGKR